MTALEIVLAFVALHIMVAAIMAVFPRDEVMRSKTGISSYTPAPMTVGDYFFNGLVLLLSGGGLFMEYINEKITKRRWWWRVGIRSAVILGAIVIAFIAGVLGSIFSE